MSLLIATRAELIKNRRSAAFWLCLIGASFISFILLLSYSLRPDLSVAELGMDPWSAHFNRGWQSFSTFLLPMFVILICSLIPQIEYKNNTWKQVFASPLSMAEIFFSKYLSILAMVVFLFVIFNLTMLLTGLGADLVDARFTFMERPVRWGTLLAVNLRSIISLLAIVSIQYWMSLRFRNFIVPIGIGLGLLVSSLILMSWKHAGKIPYAFPFLTFNKASSAKPGAPFLAAHEIYSMIYFVFFTLLAFADLSFRRERG